MFIPLSSLLQSATNRTNVRERVDISLTLERVSQFLDRALPSHVRSKAKPSHIKYKTLAIAVEDASTAAQLGFLEQGILQIANGNSHTPIIQRIQVIRLEQEEGPYDS